jgi:heptaprenylglyceryl phosphate synthase
MKILDALQERSHLGKKSIAVLVDPDKIEDTGSAKYVTKISILKIVLTYFFVGGSLVTTTNLSEVVNQIKENVSIPVVLFPRQFTCKLIHRLMPYFILVINFWSQSQILLIGQHVVAAPILKNNRLEVMPTGYLAYQFWENNIRCLYQQYYTYTGR